MNGDFDVIELILGAHATAVRHEGEDYILELDDGHEPRGDRLLVATGRPRVADIGLETVGIDADGRGIQVDARMRAGERLWAIAHEIRRARCAPASRSQPASPKYRRKPCDQRPPLDPCPQRTRLTLRTPASSAPPPAKTCSASLDIHRSRARAEAALAARPADDGRCSGAAAAER